MNKLFATALLVASLATPAFAQTTEFYVVQDATTKKCTIVDAKPMASTTVVSPSGTVYKTRAEAETGMKTIKVCTTN